LDDVSDVTEGPKNIWPPLFPAIVCIFCFFSFLFNFVLLGKRGERDSGRKRE
jgi:hypothetical protein